MLEGIPGDEFSTLRDELAIKSRNPSTEKILLYVH
jgi:hypothetical protein